MVGLGGSKQLLMVWEDGEGNLITPSGSTTSYSARSGSGRSEGARWHRHRRRVGVYRRLGRLVLHSAVGRVVWRTRERIEM
jgi:hypothetical protein